MTHPLQPNKEEMDKLFDTFMLSLHGASTYSEMKKSYKWDLGKRQRKYKALEETIDKYIGVLMIKVKKTTN